MDSQYLTRTTLEAIQPSAEVLPESLDTYDERRILESIQKGNINELFAIGLQFAIVGMGNKAFGTVKINGESFNVIELAKKNNVKLAVMNAAKLEPYDLTVKRLARFFRYHISDYIEKHQQPSFLYKKYCTDASADPKYVFPGAEYLVTPQQSNGLLNAYSNVDKAINTNFQAKVRLIIHTRVIRSQHQ